MAKNTTSDYLRLDVRKLQRDGFLGSGRSGTLRWSRNGEAFASIRFRSEPNQIILRYRHRSFYEEDWKEEEYPVSLASTNCNYGGKRLWFLCPVRDCNRRVAVLYCDGVFACRHCHQLAYESQREAPHSRALSRAQAILEKLGGSGSMAESFPGRPKGMHHGTYWRLCHEYEHAQNRSWPPWLLKYT